MLFIPASIFAYTSQQVISELEAHMGKISSLEADVTIKSYGVGKVIKQIGHIKYIDDFGTTFEIFGEQPLKVVTKKSGEVTLNGEQQSIEKGNTSQMGDIFLLSLIKMFKIKMGAENQDYVTLYGYDKSKKLSKTKLLRVKYNKEKKVIENIKYRGTDYDYPYDMSFEYVVIKGIPILTKITTIMSAFSVTMTSEAVFENVTLEVRQ